MKNPNSPYPGRQLFLGLTPKSRPCMAYLVTGRSPESRERRATPNVNTFYMGPLANAPYDALRHYTAIKYDNATGVLAVTNGIQTEAVYEVYKLLVNVGSFRSLDYLEKVLDGADAEPDSYQTPRIAGVIVPAENKTGMKYILGIKSAGRPARAYEVKIAPGRLTGISTYKGDMEKPAANQTDAVPPEIEVPALTAENLAKFVFEISAADYKGQDIRVCCIGGIFSENGNWELYAHNAH
ncbi:MAG TPA: IMP cyclohydrolase [Dehalococcoidales bacterium]|nr:IMP cyclohydrolase [Dehalococcoidales bacterium]